MNKYEELAQNALKLAEKATAGPWEEKYSSWEYSLVFGGNPEVLIAKCRFTGDEEDEEDENEQESNHCNDAEFIAASRTLVPALANAVLVLSKALNDEMNMRGRHDR